MKEEQVKEIVIRALQLSSETSSVEFKDARGGFQKILGKLFPHFRTGHVVAILCLV